MEIVFKAHELTKKVLLIIIKQYTDAVFSIVNFEITGNDELTAIIMFNDIESAKDFIDKIREDDGSVSEIIKKISFSFADISSYSLIFYPMTLGLQVLWIF